MKKDWHGEEFRMMVVLGDRTNSSSWNIEPDQCWVPVLAALIDDFQMDLISLVDSGIRADVISTHSPSYEYRDKPDADEPFDKHVIAHEPDLFIISISSPRLNDTH